MSPVASNAFQGHLHLGTAASAVARVAAALGPYLTGARPHDTPRVDRSSMTREGVAIFFQGGRYDVTVTLARLGVLPFF